MSEALRDRRSRKVVVVPTEALDMSDSRIEKLIEEGYGLLLLPSSKRTPPEVMNRIISITLDQLEEYLRNGFLVTLLDYSAESIVKIKKAAGDRGIEWKQVIH